MRINRKDIEYIANLSRIELVVAEEEMFINQLSDILTYIDKLNQLDTENVKPMVYPLNAFNLFRNDTLYASSSKEEVLSNAPSTMGAFFKVPKVIE